MLYKLLNYYYYYYYYYSAFPETLSITDSRQYSKGGLTHITDCAYKFFLALEQKRIQLMNSELLKHSTCELLSSAIDATQGDRMLLQIWNSNLICNLHIQSLKLLPFVDMKLHISGNHLSTSIQNKATDTHSYLHHNSSHPRHCNESLLHSQF